MGLLLNLSLTDQVDDRDLRLPPLRFLNRDKEGLEGTGLSFRAIPMVMRKPGVATLGSASLLSFSKGIETGCYVVAMVAVAV